MEDLLYIKDEKKDPEVIKAYLEDEFFYALEGYLDTQDYALAKDATKGLYYLAGDLALYELYTRLIDIYEDLEYKEYQDVIKHYHYMMEEYERLKKEYHD